MIEFNRAVAIWFCTIKDGNFLGAILTHADGHHVLRWRVRKTASENWYESTNKMPLDDMLYKTRLILRTAATMAEQTGPLHEIVRGERSEEEFLRELMSQPWAHVTRTQ